MNQREKTSSGINIITSLADTIDWITDSFVNCSLPLPKASWLHKKTTGCVFPHDCSDNKLILVSFYFAPFLQKNKP